MGFSGNRKKECMVWPPTLMAAMPVKASFNTRFFVLLAKY
jgi:hypothetical protein